MGSLRVSKKVNDKGFNPSDASVTLKELEETLEDLQTDKKRNEIIEKITSHVSRSQDKKWYSPNTELEWFFRNGNLRCITTDKDRIVFDPSDANVTLKQLEETLEDLQNETRPSSSEESSESDDDSEANKAVRYRLKLNRRR